MRVQRRGMVSRRDAEAQDRDAEVLREREQALYDSASLRPLREMTVSLLSLRLCYQQGLQLFRAAGSAVITEHSFPGGVRDRLPLLSRSGA